MKMIFKKSHNHLKLRSWSFLLSFEQSEQRNICNFNHLESDSRNITDSVSLTSETRHQHLVVLFNVIQTTIVGTNAVIFLPFLMSCTRTHFLIAELGCFASTPTFSSTIPLACEAPPKGLAFKAVPKCAFL